jgi:colanic acid/amylovoran biosynthesis glycosyltransferase
MKILIMVKKYGVRTHTFVRNHVDVSSRKNEVIVLANEVVDAEKWIDTDLRIIPFNEPKRLGPLLYRLRDRGWYYSYRNRLFAVALEKMLNDCRPDVMHFHFGTYAPYVLQNLRNFERWRIFVSFHGIDASAALRNPGYVRFLRKYFARPNVTPVFACEAIRRYISSFGIDCSGGKILYCGVDTDFFKREPVKREPKPFVFTQISSFRDKKGHAVTIRTFKKLLDHVEPGSVRLILGGDGPLLEASKELCVELGIQNLVDFPGWCSAEMTREILNHSDAFVHHSVTPPKSGDREGTTTSTMEAMAMELPVVASNHSGIPEVVETGVNGLLVEEYDVDSYVEALKSIMGWGLQPENRKKIVERFSKEVHERNLERLYE